jgi:diguanylate cyclase (GGDEF)-like protein
LAGILATAATFVINGAGDNLSAHVSWLPAPIAIWNTVLRVAAVAFMIMIVSAFRRTFDRERSHARSDPLTGLGNRRSFDTESRKISLDAAQNGYVLLCGVIALDDFKQVNDRHGHACGDETLRTVASALAASLRPDDAIARIGGDEFAFCLMVRNIFVAKRKVEEIHERISGALDNLSWQPTCSIGASADQAMNTAFCLADAALYAAKGESKNSCRFQV